MDSPVQFLYCYKELKFKYLLLTKVSFTITVFYFQSGIPLHSVDNLEVNSCAEKSTQSRKFHMNLFSGNSLSSTFVAMLSDATM